MSNGVLTDVLEGQNIRQLPLGGLRETAAIGNRRRVAVGVKETISVREVSIAVTVHTIEVMNGVPFGVLVK